MFHHFSNLDALASVFALSPLWWTCCSDSAAPALCGRGWRTWLWVETGTVWTDTSLRHRCSSPSLTLDDAGRSRRHSLQTHNTTLTSTTAHCPSQQHTTIIQTFSAYIQFIHNKKIILLFSIDALNGSKVTVKIFIILQKISISNKCCSIKLSTHLWILKNKNICQHNCFPHW